jgi:hypothetical protein
MSTSADSGGPSPIQPLVLLTLTFFIILSPRFFSHDDDSDAETKTASSWAVDPAVWLPVLLVLLVVAIYISWLMGESSAGLTVTRVDASTIHKIGGSSWGIGALLLLLIIIILCSSNEEDA